MAAHSKSRRSKRLARKLTRSRKRRAQAVRRNKTSAKHKPKRPTRQRSLQRKRRRRSRRRMITFSNGQRHFVVLSRRMAGTNGRYLNAVRRLLHTNDPSALDEFAGQSIKDIHGGQFLLETRANTLYRANSVPEPIAEIYQVLT